MKIITPNSLTVLRVILTAVGVIMLLNSHLLATRVGAFLILLLAGLTDMWDGQLARKSGQITSFGKILDPIADKFFTLGVMTVFSFLNLYSIWWVVLIGFREILVTIVRIVYLTLGKVMAAEGLGKIKTVSQMTSLSVSTVLLLSRDNLSQLPFWSDWITLSLTILNYTVLSVALILTLISGFTFFLNLGKK